jgi:glycosidase
LGVDGFRIDHMMDDLDGKGIKTGLLTRFWRPILDDVRRRYPRSFFVAEQADWGWGKDLFAKAKVDAVYATVLWDAIKAMDRDKLVRAIRETAAVTPPGATQLLFAENHDVDRLATAVGHDPAKTRLAMALTFALKGTPTLYYGQELGMRGRKGPWPSDGADIPLRLAYEWGRRRNAAGTALWYRGTGPWWNDAFARDDDGISVEEQVGRPVSMFEFTRRLTALRHGDPALREGTQRVLGLANPALLAVERRHGARRVVFVANLSGTAQRIPLRLGRDLWTRRPSDGGVPVPAFGFRFAELR